MYVHDHLRRKSQNNAEKWKKIILILVVSFFSIGMFSFFILWITLPDIDNPENLIAAQSSLILDRKGEILYAIHGDENRKDVTYDQISEYVPLAAMAIEDDEFYEHHGVDFVAFGLALCREFFLCSGTRGGSTITQQYIKNAFLSTERTYTRKAKEVILSLQLEGKFTKDEIMEKYLNRIPYGANIYGVEVAAKTFFGKSASDLTIAEAAILASIPKAPTYYSPYGSNIYAKIDVDESEIIKHDIYTEQDIVDEDPNFISKGLLGKTYTLGEGEEARDIYIKGRVAFVLERMELLGFITKEEKQLAQEEADSKEFTPFRDEIEAPHFVMYVRQILEEKYGKEQIEKGGLRITTTLDLEMQKEAEEAVEARGDHNERNFDANNASVISIEPNTGQIMAMVGSRDYWNDEIDGKVNITVRPRLPGSSFKPIVYASAFLAGYAPSTVLYDVKTKFGEWYEPENFDGSFKGPVNLRDSLGASLNIPAVKAGHLAGVQNVIDLARTMGIALNQPDDWYGLSLALGAGEASPIDMALAYAVFANGGYKVEPISILKVIDRNGSILEEYSAPEERTLVLDPQVAYLINDVLSDTNTRPGSYWQNQLNIPGHENGAKTGTSNKKKEEVNYPFDTWTIGYVRNLVTAVWAGNADGRHLRLNASGLDTASHIWRNFMLKAVERVEKQKFDVPEGIRWVRVAERSGKLPSKQTPEGEIAPAIFTSFSVPSKYDDSYEFVEIDKVSGLLATEFTPEAAREMKGYYTHSSILPNNTQWQSAVRKWAEENNQDEQPPTEYSTVHTSDNTDEKPQITIVSPKSKSTVSPPKLGVRVNISSPAGVNKVEYYFDDELLHVSTKAPFNGVLNLDQGLEGSYQIKAVIYDELFRVSQATTSVKIGEDETKPVVDFTYPSDDAKLEAGASVTAQINTYDPNGGVKNVRFYMDGKLKKDDTSLPFNWQLIVPEDLGKYELKAEAFDYTGNKSTSKIDIRVIEPSETLTGTSRILKPRNNASYDEGGQVLIQGFIDEDSRETVKEVVVLSKKAGSQAEEITKIFIGNEGAAPTYSIIWDSPEAGTYELYLKIILQDGKLRFTKKVPVVIR